MKVAPQVSIEKIISLKPSLISCLPLNREFVFKRYLGSISMNVNTVYPIERQIFTGFYDKETLSVIDRFVKEGDVCFDIGANVGPVSFAMAKKVGPAGKVYAFEPGSFLFKRLVDNIKLNASYGNIIEAQKIAFSDKKEVRVWNEDKKNRGNAGFIIQGPNQQEKIELTTLDNFIKDNPVSKINFIKIDVEGMEYEVIRGAIETIKKFKPVLYYETGFFDKGFWSEVARGEKVIYMIEKMLEEIGYSTYKVEQNQIKPARYPDLSYNTLAFIRQPGTCTPHTI